MNREQAIQNFYSQFLTAYDETDVPDKAELPYLTYSVQVGTINSTLLLSASLWYRSTKWKEITLKANEIMDGINGQVIKYDGGAILLTAGSPKYQRVDSGVPNIRRIVLNLQMEFLEV